MKIPFNRPYLTGRELPFIRKAHKNGVLAGDGPFTRKCQSWLESELGARKALLTHSCTSALEMAAMIAGIRPGDEVIMPSFTFVSTANAFVLRGAIPVFVDIRADTLNLNEELIVENINHKTKAIVVVHYAGVGAEMSKIMAIAKKHNLLVIEDAAHGINATYRGQELGTIGHLGCLSFHETKNVVSGEGGALLVNHPKFLQRAEFVWQKGTNRKAFEKGLVSKYKWVDEGSSFLPGEITAAFLYAQLCSAQKIKRLRENIWKKYQIELASWVVSKKIRQPVIPSHCSQNYHMYYLILPAEKTRQALLNHLNKKEIGAVFHYLPLHKSPFYRKNYNRRPCLPITEQISKTIIRLPFYTNMSKKHQDFILKTIKKWD